MWTLLYLIFYTQAISVSGQQFSPQWRRSCSWHGWTWHGQGGTLLGLRFLPSVQLHDPQTCHETVVGCTASTLGLSIGETKQQKIFLHYYDRRKMVINWWDSRMFVQLPTHPAVLWSPPYDHTRRMIESQHETAWREGRHVDETRWIIKNCRHVKQTKLTK